MKRLIAEEKKQIVFSNEDIDELQKVAEKCVKDACESVESYYSDEYSTPSEYDITENDIEDDVIESLDEDYCSDFWGALEDVLRKYIGDDAEKVAEDMIEHDIASLSIALGYDSHDFKNVGQLLYDFGNNGWNIDAREIANDYNDSLEQGYEDAKSQRKEEEREYYNSVMPGYYW
jgi:hypothetical protein